MLAKRQQTMREASNIKVVCRFRPLIDIELQLPENKAEHYSFPDDSTVSVAHSNSNPDNFIYDKVFPPNTEQPDIFECVGKPIIEDILAGYNGTVFAYGQTGSGKSYTMMGLDIYDDLTRGIIPRAISLIFDYLSNAKDEAEYTLKCSMLEIYKETLKDLLGNNTNLKIKEDPRRGIYVQGLTEMYVVCEEEMVEVLSLGESNRTVASTKMNQVSSRSHQLFMLEVNQKFPNDTEKRGILNLVDLAGCEKINQTGVTGNKLEEAKKINLSLSALGNVIHALTSNQEHIPYRDSKLTRLLQESLGGNYKTTLIVNCSPHPRNLEDTLNTLKFAQRAKTIKNKVKLNIKRSPEAYMKMIAKLKKKLADAKDEIKRLKKSLKESSPTIPQQNSPSLPTEEDQKSEDFRSTEDIGVSFAIDKRRISLVDDFGQNDQIIEELYSLKQDKENLESKVSELEDELSREQRKRIKAETSSSESFECYKKLLIMKQTDENAYKAIVEENRSLKKQIEMLISHLNQANNRFSDSLSKIKAGETVSEWEFIDATVDAALTGEIPVQTEETSLLMTKINEVEIDMPLNISVLKTQDLYSQELCTVLEDNSDISSEIVAFQLRKQVIQSGLINCELIRRIYDLQWKYNLLKEKFNLKLKLSKFQENKIGALEQLVDHLHNSFNKIINLMNKLENEHWGKEKLSDPTPKGKFIRGIRPTIIMDKPDIRRSNRMNTALNYKLFSPSPRFDDITPRFAGLKASFGDHGDQNDPYKVRSLETNLEVQTLFNQQIKNGYEIAKSESTTFKLLLETYQHENLEVYLKEKDRWKEYVDSLKNSCEKELARKQSEINELHEVLGRWINMFLDLQEKAGIPRSQDETDAPGLKRSLTKEYYSKIEDLIKQTKTVARPIKISLNGSPFHLRFRKPSSLSVFSQSGDKSPPVDD
ncbi:unnamed protein product [Blepharisma stoltei]|uniref:Kinesin motor domain-containing protein n=1 Tax=Blepharisma stoltei TaxID=1481888 RepID=A0AAU9K4F2_9CILI|nr:unnamed protein product [Blepharisma stoltei]